MPSSALWFSPPLPGASSASRTPRSASQPPQVPARQSALSSASIVCLNWGGVPGRSRPPWPPSGGEEEADGQVALAAVERHEEAGLVPGDVVAVGAVDGVLGRGRL